MPTKPESGWMQPAAELMAREGATLAEALTRLKIPLNSSEIGATLRTKQFQRILRGERNRFYREVGNDPEWSKKVAVGILLECSRRLMEEGEFDKAAEVVLKASKVEGWLNGETNVNVFAGLTGNELAALKDKIKVANGEPAPN